MISRKQAEETLSKLGIPSASEDDPIYNEPPQVQFINRSGKSSKNTEKQPESTNQEGMDPLVETKEEHQTTFVVRGDTLELDLDISDITRAYVYSIDIETFSTSNGMVENALEVQPVFWKLQEGYEEFRDQQIDHKEANELWPIDPEIDEP